MEAVATVASITALVTVALQSAAQINNILAAIKDGPTEIQQLLEGVHALETALRGTLQATRDAQRISDEYLLELHAISGRCERSIESLKKNLINLCTKRGDGSRAGIRPTGSMGWTSDIKINSFETSIETITRSLSKCVQAPNRQGDSNGANIQGNSSIQESTGQILSMSPSSTTAAHPATDMLFSMRADMQIAQQEQMNALSSLNQNLVDQVQACQDMSVAQSRQIQELLKALGQSLSNQVSTIQITVPNDEIRNDPPQEDSSAERDKIADNAIKRHVENLCSLAKDREGCVESEQAEEIIEELQGLLNLFNAPRRDANPEQHGRKRKAESKDDLEGEVHRKKKRVGIWRKLTGLMTTTDAIQVNGNGRSLKAFHNTIAYELESDAAILSVIATTHHHEETIRASDLRKSFSARATILPKSASFKNKITLSVSQQVTLQGYSSIHPTLTFANIIPFESPVFEIIKAGDLNEFELMLRTGQALLSDCDPEGRSFLTYAYYNSRPEICQFLVENGSDPNPVEVGLDDVYSEYFLPTMSQKYCNWSEVPVERLDRSQKCLKILLEHGADATVRKKVPRYDDCDESWDGGSIVVEMATRSGETSPVFFQQTLRNDIGFIDFEKYRDEMLSEACRGHGTETFNTVRLLLEKGADLNRRNCNGDTAIHTLLKSRRQGKCLSHALRDVIKAGGNIHSKTRSGYTPSQLARRRNDIWVIYGTDRYLWKQNPHWAEWSIALRECGIEQAEIVRMECEAIGALQDRGEYEDDDGEDNDNDGEEGGDDDDADEGVPLYVS
ncbi:hypothetical protein LTR84_004774 [Exophiala bonariae]|uniref:Azaphilone pigments biosynthesis cluster protein L N-terminal domain-containing protein n=1 Tax=Exophiala bonariae TaxID=1690606 RepID=A0AAV9NRX2_9EURO|nr:hypothetical protein LTR84_004774 [Exophiala bonariae]